MLLTVVYYLRTHLVYYIIFLCLKESWESCNATIVDDGEGKIIILGYFNLIEMFSKFLVVFLKETPGKQHQNCLVLQTCARVDVRVTEIRIYVTFVQRSCNGWSLNRFILYACIRHNSGKWLYMWCLNSTIFLGGFYLKMALYTLKQRHWIYFSLKWRFFNITYMTYTQLLYKPTSQRSRRNATGSWKKPSFARRWDSTVKFYTDL